MANIDDVAKLASVSIATVSAVLNGLDTVKPETRRRVLEAIAKLNYQPNLYARSLARGRSTMIGLVISDIINPFFSEIAQVVQAEANRRGYQVFIAATQFSLERLQSAVTYLIGMRAAGLVVMTTEMDRDTLAILRSRKTPVVFEDVGTVDRHTSNLRIDYEGGIVEAFRCLVEHGHKHVLYVENPPAGEKRNLLSIRIREEAFRVAAGRVPGMETWRLALHGPAYAAGFSGAADALRQYPFTAALVSADPVALGFLRGLQSQGRRIPDDISVIGFDNSQECQYTDPPLASVGISREAIGRLAVESLVEMIEKNQPGREIYVPAKLVLRGSVGKASAKKVSAGSGARRLR